MAILKRTRLSETEAAGRVGRVQHLIAAPPRARAQRRSPTLLPLRTPSSSHTTHIASPSRLLASQTPHTACSGYLRDRGIVISLLTTAPDFCRATDQHEHWLPRQVPNDGGSASSCYSCPTRSLLPSARIAGAGRFQCSPRSYRPCFNASRRRCCHRRVLSPYHRYDNHPQAPPTSCSSPATIAPRPLCDGRACRESDTLCALHRPRRLYVFIGEHVFAEGRTWSTAALPTTTRRAAQTSGSTFSSSRQRTVPAI